jgi:RimJ/RimL family protein N-acetyltransferase
MPLNAFGQTIGGPLSEWKPCDRPARIGMQGAFCRLDPLDPSRHADDLYDAYAAAPDARDWTYMNVGPFRSVEEYRRYAEEAARKEDPLQYAVIDSRSGKAVGALSLMRQDPANGVIEVGGVMFSPLMKRTPISTEAQFLLMAYVFDDLGYRRYEWKCDSLNQPSREAAERLGFTFEGIFRRAVVYKGRNRDTAWFSVIDEEWPRIKQAFAAWLSTGNFDDQGRQRRSLQDVRASLG